MRTKGIIGLALTALLFCPFEAAFAQNPNRDIRRPAKRKEVKQLVDNMYIWKLTEALDLSEEQATKIFPRLNKARKEKRELAKEADELMRKLKDVLKEETAEEAETILKETVAELKELRRAVKEKEEEEIKILEENLSVEQQAKLILFQRTFRKKIGHMVERAREFRQKHRGERKRREMERERREEMEKEY